jgi:hypothetical protein
MFMIAKSVSFLTACLLLAPAASRTDNLADYVEYQTFELDGEITDMMWCGSNDETILVQTAEGNIYRSRDRGSNWKRLKSLMQKIGTQVADENQDVS